MKPFAVLVFGSCFLVAFTQHTNDVEGRRAKADDVLWDFMDNCINSQVESVSTCLKLKVRKYVFMWFKILVEP